VRALVSSLLFFACIFCPPAAADQVPLDEAGFTAFVAKVFQKKHSDASVTVTGPLRLNIKAANENWASYLFTLYSYCTRNPATCEEHIVIHAEQIAASHKDEAAPREAIDLRIVVRQKIYVDQIAASLAGRGKPVAEPIVGDLWLLAVFDRPTTVSFLKPKDLETLHLTAEAALARAKENTKAIIGSRIPQDSSSSGEISIMGGDAYQASLLAFPELWAPLAKANDNRLIVAVPGSDVMLFTREDKGESIEALAKVSEATMEGEFRPFSATVFRWTDKGWITVER
jgi:hypothetical protein